MSDFEIPRLRDDARGPGTLISQGCKITGAISGCGNFQISGEIDGDCDLDGSISITKSGYWRGAIRATTIIISGTVDGDIVASGCVEISDTARISGTITGESIAVAEGAVVEGIMKTTRRTRFVELEQIRADS